MRLLWPHNLDAKPIASNSETSSKNRETLHETNQPEKPDSSKISEKGEAQKSKVGEAAEIHARTTCEH